MSAFAGLQRAIRFTVFRCALAGQLLIAGSCWCGGLPNFLIDLWDNETGLPNSSVTSLAQTPDGYLWVGTYNGLARFDGVRFTTFGMTVLDHPRVQGLYVDCSGTLWINTYRGGLTSYRDRVFRREWPGHGEFDVRIVLATSSSNEVLFVRPFGDVLRRAGSPGGTNAVWSTLSPPRNLRPKYACADGAGRLWFVDREGKVLRMANWVFEELSGCGLDGETVLTLAADPAGRVWAGTERQVARWDGHRFQSMTPTNGEPRLEASYVLPTGDGGAWVLAEGRLRKLIGRRWVAEASPWHGLLGSASERAMGMHEDREGGVWFNHYGNGLFHVSAEQQLERFTAREGLPGERVWDWFQDREGNIWAGIDRGGLVRLRKRAFELVGQAEGLPARAALSVCEDKAGAMWFGTSGGGLCRWEDGELKNFNIGSDRSENLVFSAFPKNDGGLWLSAGAGEELWTWIEGTLERSSQDIRGIKSILTDSTGRVWLGTKLGLTCVDGDQRRNFGTREGLSLSAARALALDRDGVVWMGNDEGTLFRCEPDRLIPYRPADALAGQPIWSILADADGALWAGTFGGGLLRFEDGRFKRLTTEQGLPSDCISQLMEDANGQLWMGTLHGIARVPKSALIDCLQGKTKRVDCVTYGRSDGLPTLECAGNYQPACWQAADGRLWFATVRGIVTVHPHELKANQVPPSAIIEELRVDEERVPLDGTPVLISPGRRQFEFRFTAPSFIAPDRVRFRYRLEGWDADWVEADTLRAAQYSRLPARQYQFRVVACAGDGKWNTEGASLSLQVLPHFYETWWFLTLASVGLVLGIAGGARAITTRKYRQALARLQQQHAVERDRARIAQDIHDDLGAGLTQITLLSELAQRESPSQVPAHLERISNSARKLTRAMDEIVWAIDPQHDSLNGLMDYISAFAEDFLRTARVRCRMDVPAFLPELRIDAETRYHLFLAFKEALNNVVKHANASEVRLGIRLEPKSLTLMVEDNGRGLNVAADPGQAKRPGGGHGLTNLEQRLAGIGGHCFLDSAPGQGTRVELTIPLAGHASSPVLVTVQSGAMQDNKP